MIAPQLPGLVLHRQEKDPTGGQLGRLTDVGGHGEGVGPGEAGVEHHQREGPTGGGGLPERFQGR